MSATCDIIDVRCSEKSADEFVVHQVFIATFSDDGSMKHAVTFPEASMFALLVAFVWK